MLQAIITGSLSYDYIMDFRGLFTDRIMPDKIHNISLSFHVDKLARQMGGTAGNIAYSLKLLGVEPCILSSAGNDFDSYRNFFNKNGISTQYITIIRKDTTSLYFVVTDKADNQIGAFYSGATKFAKTLSLTDVVRKRKDTTHPPFIVISPTDPDAMRQYVTQCRKGGYKYLYDPAFQIGDFTAEDLRVGIGGAEILIGNDYEISLIEQKLEITHEELRVMVPVTVTTLGQRGSVIETRREAIHIRPAEAKNTQDPTGAGDAYRAGFLAGYLRGLSLTTCGQMGSVAAVYTVEKYGTVTHRYTLNEFSERYRMNFNQELKFDASALKLLKSAEI